MANIHMILFYYNITNDSLWFLINYLIPLIISVLTSNLVQKKQRVVNLGKIFLPILIALSFIGGTLNFIKWNYFFKRPSVFSELRKANEILSITKMEKNKISNDTILFPHVDINPDYYYYSVERPIITMLEEWSSKGNLFDYNEIFKSKDTKLSTGELSNIKKQIEKTRFIDQPQSGYEEYNKLKSALFIEFTTSNNNNVSVSSNKPTRKPSLDYDKIYTYVLINSGELSNDTYARYEFLINNNKIIKKQKFYYDVAGFEGMEYPIFAPFIEMIFLLLTFLIYMIFELFLRFRTQQHLS